MCALRFLFPFVLPIADGETMIKMAPVDSSSSIVFLICMSTAIPAVVSVCLISLNGEWFKILLFKAYHLAWIAVFMVFEGYISIPVVVFHNIVVLTTCILTKPPFLRPILEFALHPIFHFVSHSHVHTYTGALPDGAESESELAGFQHSLCTSSPLLAALWTLFVGKKCRCHVQIFELLLLAIFAAAITVVLATLILLFTVCGVASWPMLLYPASSALMALILAAPYFLLHQNSANRQRKTPLCASYPIPFVGVALFLVPMLLCACVAPTFVCLTRYAGVPLQHVDELLLVAISSLPPYFFVRACPQALRPPGWFVFLGTYFWLHWKFMVSASVSADASQASFSYAAIRISLVFFVLLFSFLQSLSSRYVLCRFFVVAIIPAPCPPFTHGVSRNAYYNTAFRPFLDILSAVSSEASAMSDPKVTTSYWQAQAALGTATMQSLSRNHGK